MGSEHEPSVEEILESIKKVIARDNRDIAAKSRHTPISPAQGDGADAPLSESDGILELRDMEQIDSDEALADEASSEGWGEQDASSEVLTSEQVRAAIEENFAALSALAEPGARPQIVRSGETSLEQLVREMLRPMLAQWLDNHLPAIVEKLVQAEIARIARKRQ